MTTRVEVISVGKQGPGGPGAAPAAGEGYFLISKGPANAFSSAPPADARAALNVEDGAAADQTPAEIKAAYEGNADTNAFTDAEKAKLAAGLAANGDLARPVPNAMISEPAVRQHEGALVIAWGQISGRPSTLAGLGVTDAYTQAEINAALALKLDAAAYTPADVRAKIAAASDSHVFTDADHAKLSSVTPGADIADPGLVELASLAGLAHKRLDGAAPRRGQVTIANAQAGAWFTPAGNTAVVSLDPPMDRTDYAVHLRVRSAAPSAALAGPVEVIDQATNAFTVRAPGSAQNIVIDWRVTA